MGLKMKVVNIVDGLTGDVFLIKRIFVEVGSLFTLFKQELMAALFKQNRVFVVILWRDSPNRARSYFGFNLS